MLFVYGTIYKFILAGRLRIFNKSERLKNTSCI